MAGWRACVWRAAHDLHLTRLTGCSGRNTATASHRLPPRPARPPAGAVPWLAQLLLFGGAGSKEAAAACLAELAAVGPAVQQAIRDAGAVQLLEGLQTSGK